MCVCSSCHRQAHTCTAVSQLAQCESRTSLQLIWALGLLIIHMTGHDSMLL